MYGVPAGLIATDVVVPAILRLAPISLFSILWAVGGCLCVGGGVMRRVNERRGAAARRVCVCACVFWWHWGWWGLRAVGIMHYDVFPIKESFALAFASCLYVSTALMRNAGPSGNLASPPHHPPQLRHLDPITKLYGAASPALRYFVEQA